LLLCALAPFPSPGTADEFVAKSDFESLYDPGIPTSVSVEWSFPSGFSLCIDSGHQLRIGDRDPGSDDASNRISTFPLLFSLQYELYEHPWLSQSVSLGLGPTFLHDGAMPVRLKDIDVRGGSHWATEWVSRLSRDISIHLKMKYSHVVRAAVDGIPLGDFTTWLGLHLRW
jgi:hypothetical protein